MGRVLVARGRDRCDVAITTTFGPHTLESFRVWTDEIPARRDSRYSSLVAFLTVRHSIIYRHREPSARSTNSVAVATLREYVRAPLRKHCDDGAFRDATP